VDAKWRARRIIMGWLTDWLRSGRQAAGTCWRWRARRTERRSAGCSTRQPPSPSLCVHPPHPKACSLPTPGRSDSVSVVTQSGAHSHPAAVTHFTHTVTSSADVRLVLLVGGGSMSPRDSTLFRNEYLFKQMPESFGQVEAKQAQVAEQNEIERRARMAQLQRDQAERKVSGGR
jgi:hypothetical protein